MTKFTKYLFCKSGHLAKTCNLKCSSPNTAKYLIWFCLNNEERYDQHPFILVILYFSFMPGTMEVLLKDSG